MPVEVVSFLFRRLIFDCLYASLLLDGSQFGLKLVLFGLVLVVPVPLLALLEDAPRVLCKAHNVLLARVHAILVDDCVRWVQDFAVLLHEHGKVGKARMVRLQEVELAFRRFDRVHLISQSFGQLL